MPLPAGLRESDALPAPIFTPATKAEAGEHDENIGFDAMVALVGGELAERIRAIALRLYAYAATVERGLAGSCWPTRNSSSGSIPRPGSCSSSTRRSRPIPRASGMLPSYEPGRPQASFDKQFVRDWLETQPWDKTAPGPALPDDVVEGTRARYVEAFERITGASFERYLREDVIAP